LASFILLNCRVFFKEELFQRTNTGLGVISRAVVSRVFIPGGISAFASVEVLQEHTIIMKNMGNIYFKNW
jgi:hypothetical protein